MMGFGLETWVQLGLFILICLGITYSGGTYLDKVYGTVGGGGKTFHLPVFSWIETMLLSVCGISNEIKSGKNIPQGTWQGYCIDLLLMNGFAAVLAYLILVFQDQLPLNPLQLKGMEPWQAFNTVASFVTNTNWQSYSGESSLSLFSQMVAIVPLMVIGALSGLVVCIAFLRGLTHHHASSIGNFYQDAIRGFVYVFLPMMVVGCLFLVSQGVPQTLEAQQSVKTLEGPVQTLATGPVASLVVIKQFGTNGGGYFNANSAHPFENPNAVTNGVEILWMLVLPMSLVFLFGKWLNSPKQGWLIWGCMMGLLVISFWVGMGAEGQGNHLFKGIISASDGLGENLGFNFEGKEARFSLFSDLLFTTVTTSTSTGAVNNMHDSLTPLGGLVPLWNMMLNVIFGGVGVGLMGFLLYGIIAVFLTGLMVGRTPEIFGKKLEKQEIILASIGILAHPALILIPTAVSVVNDFGLSSLANHGPHGFSEILYAFTSAAANNGSAFAGLNANTPWYNISIGSVILLGRYVSIILLMAIAGSLWSKVKTEPGPGTLKTDTVLFSFIWLGVILIVGALTFVPVLVLGPISEYLQWSHGKMF
jgi:potassium-transporting ATPase potassium-binding subunit